MHHRIIWDQVKKKTPVFHGGSWKNEKPDCGSTTYRLQSSDEHWTRIWQFVNCKKCLKIVDSFEMTFEEALNVGFLGMDPRDAIKRNKHKAPVTDLGTTHRGEIPGFFGGINISSSIQGIYPKGYLRRQSRKARRKRLRAIQNRS